MKQVTVINMFSVKPGKMDAFITAQRNFSNAMSARQTGIRGGRMYKSVDGTRTVLVSQFESAEAQQSILTSGEFQKHLAHMRDMVESSSPGLYEEAYTTGKFN